MIISAAGTNDELDDDDGDGDDNDDRSSSFGEYRKKGRLAIVTVIHLRDLCIFNPVVRA